MSSTIKEQCHKLYLEQAAVIAAANRKDVQRLGALVGAFTVPLVALKCAPSVLLMAGIAAVGYVGFQGGSSVAGQIHEKCCEVSGVVPPEEEDLSVKANGLFAN